MPTRQVKRPLWTTLMLVLASLLLPSPLRAAEENSPAPISALPAFRHQGVVLDYKDLKYNPCNDIIIPSVIATGQLQKPLGLYLAWSKDGRTWETRRTPLVDPPPGTGQIAQAWYFPWRGRHYLIYHGHLADRFQTANLYASEIDPAFERPTYLGLFYDHTTASPDNVAQMSPCFLEAKDQTYMFTNVGPRLNQKIALAVAEVAP